MLQSDVVFMDIPILPVTHRQVGRGDARWDAGTEHAARWRPLSRKVMGGE
jgi:hypothetical protein